MKKIIFLFVFLLAFFLSLNFSFAQEFQESTVSAENVKEINYALPYPGLLSDNPLYVFKILRDAIVNFLISDPIKKADFNLLQADKRLNEGLMLFAKGEAKYKLGVAVIAKGESYFDEAIKQIEWARKQKKQTKSILENLYQSALKHEELLESLKSRLEGSMRKEIERQRQRASKHKEKVKELIL